MTTIQTPGAYIAANGHIMVRPKTYTTPRGNAIPAPSFTARCAPECADHGACSEGIPLEDW